MDKQRKFDLEQRLEAYFAMLGSSSLAHKLKRAAEDWQLYAAVTGSAMAMATSASAAIIGNGSPDTAPAPSPSASATKQRFASSRNVPLINAARAAIGRRPLDHATQATPGAAPSITPKGVVPIFGTVNTIQPGEWVSIYGSNLASETLSWNGDFPTLLGGTSVTIDGKPAYLLFVSPGQINVQAPDDTATGTVAVVVTTAAGSATSSVTLSQFAPSLSVRDIPQAGEFVAGVILRPDGRGFYGGGSYDILGPTGNFSGLSMVAAYPGDTISLFGVGFGPTDPSVPAGKLFSGAAPLSPNNTLTLSINNVPVNPSWVGISSAGLYQINLTVPAGIGQGYVPVLVMIGGMQSQAGVLFPLGIPQIGGTYTSSGPSFFSGGPGFSFNSGSFRASGVRHKKKKKHYSPKLHFPPQ